MNTPLGPGAGENKGGPTEPGVPADRASVAADRAGVPADRASVAADRAGVPADQARDAAAESPAPSTESSAADDAATVREVTRKGGNRGGGWGGNAGPVEKSQNFSASAKRLIGLLAPQRVLAMVVIGLAVASVVLSVIGPKVLGHATDVIFEGWTSRTIFQDFPPGTSQDQVVAALRAAGQNDQATMLSTLTLTPGAGIDFPRLATILLWVLVIYVASSLLGWLQGYLLTGMVNRTMRKLRSDVEDKLNRLPLSYFDKQTRGEVLSRVTNDIDNVSQSINQTMSQLLTSLLTVIGTLVMMVIVSFWLTLIALISIPIMLVITAQVAKRSQKQFITQWRSTGELNSQIEEYYTGHSLVKVFGRQRQAQQRFADKNAELYESSFKAQFISGIIMPSMMFIGNLTYVLVAVVGGLRVTSGAMTIGSVQAFIQYSRQFTQPLSQVASMANVLQSGVASAERVFELLDEPEQSPDPLQPATIPAGDTKGEVRFENVDFSYSPDQPLITDLSLVADPGHTVAIVGPTGAGKTTLVNLIMRFYELNGGRITLDGVDVSTMRRDDLRSRIGMVLQDTWLFGGTIRDNIAYGRPDATEDEIIEAATATYVDRFVRSLPDGYDTVIDSEGSNVSVGEKQLITIARAFLANPSLLILDEATSSVDTRTEVLVQQAMAALRSDRTSFVIAHRLSTIRDADLILVMEHGSIVEQGTHAELIAAEGAYYRLYQSQFEAALDDEEVAPDAADLAGVVVGAGAGAGAGVPGSGVSGSGVGGADQSGAGAGPTESGSGGRVG
ncbi:ABC transporter ATP-binding protein [Nakamurella aerolata]|uniref:Fatty acid ABC transporter ATP-binding/permease protein n=1 Tax=Nakamurella aerolata TaxID=1656892 RepID=A0A849ADK0_9ACTN|nr:ABC transporter transmembrane domain-containing protein [Nakamurella aerolata]NNG34952.1 ATP-binding cassette domain-containing protein [Nakamurella aerolata]